jgi:hypothetical protein
MQAADNVELRHRLAVAFAGAVPHLVERHSVPLGIAHLLAERAQPATRYAHIRRIDVPVHIEIGRVAVQPL